MITLKDSIALSYDVAHGNINFGALTATEAADISAAFCKAIELSLNSVAIATGKVSQLVDTNGNPILDANGNIKYEIDRLPLDLAVEVVKTTGVVADILTIRKNAKAKLTPGLTGAVARLASGRLQNVNDTFVLENENISITLTFTSVDKYKFNYSDMVALAGQELSVKYKDPTLEKCFKAPSAACNDKACHEAVLSGRTDVEACYKLDKNVEDINISFSYKDKKGDK